MATSIRRGEGNYVRFAHSSGAAVAAEEKPEPTELDPGTCAQQLLCQNITDFPCVCEWTRR